jgi:hypothetical protein
VAVATVFETARRDERCDKDLGLQAAEATTAPVQESPAPGAAPPPDEIPAPAPKPKKKGWLSKLPGL